jgi:hypothetical protein
LTIAIDFPASWPCVEKVVFSRRARMREVTRAVSRMYRALERRLKRYPGSLCLTDRPSWSSAPLPQPTSTRLFRPGSTPALLTFLEGGGAAEAAPPEAGRGGCGGGGPSGGAWASRSSSSRRLFALGFVDNFLFLVDRWTRTSTPFVTKLVISFFLRSLLRNSSFQSRRWPLTISSPVFLAMASATSCARGTYVSQ